MFTPYYTISNDNGFSGKMFWSRNFLFLRIACCDVQKVSFHTEPVMYRFNPYFDLQRDCFTFGYKGKNYHLSKKRK